MAKPDYTLDQIITQLTSSWGDGDTTARLWAASSSAPEPSISVGINTSNPTNFTALGRQLSSEGNGLVAMTALQVLTARLSFQIWDGLIPRSLVESDGAGANITLNYSSTTSGNNTYSNILTHD
ncbi:MAG: hypothetical protein Q8N96_02865, partial [Methylovulum sp.]|nr:hypothetical protein [Methylovulum sp.]